MKKNMDRRNWRMGHGLGMLEAGIEERELHAAAEKALPGVYGSMRAAWKLGYTGIVKKFVKTSAEERYYLMGKKARGEK